MSVVGDFTIPADSFALSRALSAVPEMVVEADRLASHSTMEVLPFLWAAGGDFEHFERAMAADPTVTSYTIAEEHERDVLYRVEWAEPVCELVDDVIDHHAAISEARGQGEEWHLQLRFAEEEMVSAFQDHFRETGHEFEVEQLNQSTMPRQRIFGLTAEQHEALVTAVEAGYFSIPRTISAEGLGELLGISANAASQRVRRGSETLIRSGLTISDDGVEDGHAGTPL